MTGTGYLVGVYLIYGTVSVGLTIWLARTLFANGAVFLDDVFEDHPEMARAVNRLLVTGFYMANLGYAFLILRANSALGPIEAVETLTRKLGVLLVSLAAMHFFNLFLFYRLRARARAAHLPPPVAPQTVAGPQQWQTRPQWQQP